MFQGDNAPRFFYVLLICALVAGGTAAQESAQQPTANSTSIWLTVTSRNWNFVTDLRREDVRVLEDGVPQEIASFRQAPGSPLAVVLLIDVSASQRRMMPSLKQAANTFVETSLRSGTDMAAVVSFTGEAALEQEATNNLLQVREAINRLEARVPLSPIITTRPLPPEHIRLVSTAIWDAVWTTCDEAFHRTPVTSRRVIVLITDGVDTSSRRRMSEAIERANRADAVIYSIGIGDREEFDGVDEGALRRLSERTGGRSFSLRNDTGMAAAFSYIRGALQNQYLLTYSPPPRRSNNPNRRIKVEIVNPELRRQNLRVFYREQYHAQ